MATAACTTTCIIQHSFKVNGSLQCLYTISCEIIFYILMNFLISSYFFDHLIRRLMTRNDLMLLSILWDASFSQNVMCSVWKYRNGCEQSRTAFYEFPTQKQSSIHWTENIIWWRRCPGGDASKGSSLHDMAPPFQEKKTKTKEKEKDSRMALKAIQYYIIIRVSRNDTKFRF